MWTPPDISDQNGIITAYIVDVTAVQSGRNFQITSTTTMYSIDDLLPYTTYTCKVAALTGVGAGPFSRPASFQTHQTGLLLLFMIILLIHH